MKLPGLKYQYSPPMVSGVIRQEPEDFVVDELPLTEPEGSGEHVYLQIRKRSANTDWVAGQIAAHAGVRKLDVGYAGRKDRHAVTTQWFSVYLPGDSTIDWQQLRVPDFSVLQQTLGARKLRRGDLNSNRFCIRIREITPDHRMGELTERLGLIGSQGFPNYFGEQRFGKEGQNLTAADKFLRGKRRHVPGKDMLISAARSHLFNWYLSRCLESGNVPDSGPLYGRSRDPQPGEQDLPDCLVVWVEALRSRRVSAGERSLMVIPEELSWETERDELELTFSLPPGSFATSLLRELINVTDRGGQ